MKVSASETIVRPDDTVASLYKRYGRKLYGYAVSKWKLNEDAAWDLVYKTLYQTMKMKDRYSFENEQKFGGFIFKTFINYLRNHHRDTKRTEIVSVPLEEKHANTMSSTLEHTEMPRGSNPLMECLQQVLKTLEDWQRIILLMRAQEHSYEEIAPFTNKPAGQLKVYHHRLRTIVKDKTNECLDKKTA